MCADKYKLDLNHNIEKSKTLIWSKFSKYSLNEMRLVETYLSKINARDENSSEVTFSLNEYLTLLGYQEPEKVTSARIQKTLDKFLSTKIKISLGNDKDYRFVNLFSDATVLSSNPEFDKRTVTIDCNPKLKEVFFNLAEDGYIEYKLDYSLQLKSKYSIKLYSLLKDKAYFKEWRVDLKELREFLGATNKNNESFREFNKVLQNCMEEINRVTDITFSYDKITKGRLTRGIVFKIKNNYRKKRKVIETTELPGQLNFNDAPTANIRTPEEQSAFNYCKDILGEYNFTDEQIDKLMEIAEKLVPSHFTADKSPAYLYVGDILKEKVEAIEEYKMNHRIDNMFRTFYAAVAGDWQPNHPVEKPMADDLITQTMSQVPVFKK